MADLRSKTDFLGKNKIWLIQYNLLKRKFSNKSESNKFLTDDFEDLYKNKLKKEKKYKRLKMIVHKRDNPLRSTNQSLNSRARQEFKEVPR